MKRLWSEVTYRKSLLIGIAIVLVALCIPASIAVAGRNNAQPAAESSYKVVVQPAADDIPFRITSMSPYLAGNNPFALSITKSNPTDVVHIDVLTTKNTRSHFYSFADNLGKGRVRDSIEIPLSQFTPNPNDPNEVSVSIPVNGDAATSLSFSSIGIYPIAVSVSDSAGKQSRTQFSFTTYFPNVGSNGSAYSKKFLVVPLVEFSPFVDRTKISSEGKLTSYGQDTLDMFRTAQDSFDAIAASPAKSSVVLSPEALDTYSSLFSGQDNSDLPTPLVAPAQDNSTEYLADTYVPISIGELEKINKQSAYGTLLSKSRTHLSDLGYSTPSRTLVTETLTRGAIERFSQSGIDNVVTTNETFAHNLHPAQNPVNVSGGSSRVALASAETAIATHLPSELSDSARANYLVAAVSVIALEAPSLSRGAIVPLDLSQLSSRTVSQFAGALTANPLLSSGDTNDFFTNLPIDRTQTKNFTKNFSKTITSDRTQNDVNDITKYSRAALSMYEVTSPQAELARWMGDEAFSAKSRKSSKVITPNSSRALVLDVNDVIALPEKRTLTLTSRENQIPVTLRNTSKRKITLTVVITSDKLAFPKGSRFDVVLGEENTTIQIPVKARTTGSFPITITIVTPSGDVPVASQTATVRSTAFSGAGIAIMLASVFFLGLWWISHFRKSRKKPLAPVIDMTLDKQA